MKADRTSAAVSSLFHREFDREFHRCFIASFIAVSSLFHREFHRCFIASLIALVNYGAKQVIYGLAKHPSERHADIFDRKKHNKVSYFRLLKNYGEVQKFAGIFLGTKSFTSGGKTTLVFSLD